MILAAAGSIPLSAAHFSDVSTSHSNYDAIEYVESQGIVSGYTDGSFKADASINRAEFTKIIAGAVIGDIGALKNCFPDVREEWFARFVCQAKSKGFIAGYPNGQFGPGNNINFAEAAKIISNAFGYEVSTTTPWYKGYVEKLGDLKAIPTDIAGFEAKLTRGQMAEMVYRIKAKITNKSSKSYNQLAGLGSEITGTVNTSDDNTTPPTSQPGTYSSYDTSKLANANNGKVVLFFHAPWCPHCKATDADILKNLSSIPSNVTILKVDYDSSGELKNKYGVTYQHTFVQVNSGGDKLKLWAGSATLNDILKQIQ